MAASYSRTMTTVLVIFGATGDLMARKIVPALSHLFANSKLPHMLQIIGVGRKEFTDESFRAYIADLLRQQKEQQPFLSHIFYHQGNFDAAATYQTLAKKLGYIDNSWRVCSNKLFYLAVPPLLYQSMFLNLESSGLTIPCGPDEGWTRVIVEKPFGKNLQTAQGLDVLLGALFKEEQIYRIDHYLAKEMLQNILVFRFSNNLLENVWNKDGIESIVIKFFEEVGVEGRGAFYDGVGALRDIGQNHILQMLALATMDNPESLTSDAVRQKRAALLEQLPGLTDEQITKGTSRKQYIGYRDIPGVAPDSQTETYFNINFNLTAKRWNGVQVSLEGGKKLGETRKEIIVTFKHPLRCLCPPEGKHLKNKIIFRTEPREEIKIIFWSKKPGLDMHIQQADFDFIYQQTKDHTQAYEKLLLDCITGNQLLFVSTEEVKAMWRFIDPIITVWQKNLVPLMTYQLGEVAK